MADVQGLGLVRKDFLPYRRRSSSSSPRTSVQDVGSNNGGADFASDGFTTPVKDSCFRVTSLQEALTKYPGELVIAVNAGGSSSITGADGIQYAKDQSFVGGDVLRTDEEVSGTQEPSLYKTARYGNFSYTFTDLPSGEYFVDFQFAEIVFFNGPSRMRVFDVHLQEQKVIGDLDVYAEVGSWNKALFFCSRTTVTDGTLSIVFKGITGNAAVSAVSVRRCSAAVSAGSTTDSIQARTRGAQEVQVLKKMRESVLSEQNAKVEELQNECHEAWISLQEANSRIETLHNDLLSKSLTIDTLANTVETQENDLKELRQKANGGLEIWKTATINLRREIEILKSQYEEFANETKDWMTSLPDSAALITSVQTLVSDHELLKKKYAEQGMERRQLYNEVLELQGNIRVFCRCRPLNAFETTSGISGVVDFDGVKDGELVVRTGNTKKLFKFDRVFAPQDDQDVVFSNTSPVVVSVLDGYNVCIFAYGQTGTGKTFTMEGTPDNRGVNYRTLEELFRVAEDRKGQFQIDISVSVLEVYNEHIRDLLAPPPELDQAVKKLEIRQVADGGHHVPGLVEAHVNCMEEVWEVLQSGSSARAVESTNANQHSSRSHCMLCVMVKAQNLITSECTRSKLWLVDLAGSERVAKTDVQGDRLKEAQSINKSLSALGDVISALANKSSHVPFRNSKLTHLLQDSLGGDSKTLMFVQISPSDEDVGETMCSLNFASRVRGVELGPARKQLDTSELFKFKQLAERAKQEGRTKEEAVKKLEDSLRNTEVKLKVKEHMYQALADKVKDKDKSIADLEGQLAAEKKARLASQVALKDKGSQLEKALSSNSAKEGRVGGGGSGPPEKRRPLQEKPLHTLQQSLQERAKDNTAAVPIAVAHTDDGGGGPLPLIRKGSGSPTLSPVQNVEEQQHPYHENIDPQLQQVKEQEEDEECGENSPAAAGNGKATIMKAKFVPARYFSPKLRRKVSRVPMRASIASTYQINPAMLRDSVSSDDSGGVGVGGGKENSSATTALHRHPNERAGRMDKAPRIPTYNRRISSHTRPPVAAAVVSVGIPTTTASVLLGRKKAVHFASPVFQKEKTGGEGQATSDLSGTGLGSGLVMGGARGGNADPRRGGGRSAAGEAGIGDGNGIGIGGAGVSKLRRLSVVARRASGQLTSRPAGLGGAPQRVLSTGGGGGWGGVRSGTLPPPPQTKERRWNQ